MSRAVVAILVLAGGAVTFAACSGDGGTPPDASVDAAYEAPASEPLQTASISATVVSTRFITREHFLASAEMQITGEPFAEDMSRQLAGFSRDHLPPNIYFDPNVPDAGGWIDLPGFSTAVESYEYSKQPMNMVALESGAGTSLAYGPVANPTSLSGTQARDNLASLVQHFATGSNALGSFVFAPGTFPKNPSALLGNRGPGDPNPTGVGLPSENPLGWPGIMPTTHVYKSFDPSIDPSGAIALFCAISSDDDPGKTGAIACGDYECDYTTLHLRDHASQIEPVVTPGADGFSAWKFGLWVMNYLQIMHDGAEAAVSTVASSDLANVGAANNQIVGADDTGAPTAAGTFLGSSDIEGFQAQMFIEEVDNRAQDWLVNLSTSDGATLSGFATLQDALAYDYKAPLRWFPKQVAVTETDDGTPFLKPSFAIGDAGSDLLDLAGLVLGYSTFYALTDTNNADVGGSQPALVVFDGDPFPADDQKADGEATLHDRALAMLRVALVDLDRMHADPQSGVFVDAVTMQGANVQRGTTVATPSVAYAILALRTALRALSSQLELYSNNTPDTAVATTVLDVLPLNHPSNATFSQRVKTMMETQGGLLYDHLTDASGRAYTGWDVSKSAHVDESDTLDAHTAAIRGLFAMYLATGDVKYRTRAMAVYARMDATFYDASARIYGSSPAPVDTVDFTPVRFAMLQSALRDVYELVIAHPGNAAQRPLLESRIARLNKLVLNGWDDRNENRLVDWPDECVNVVSSLPRGGLQMGERTLTGEIGSLQDITSFTTPRTPTSDREQDCVPEVDDAHLPAALAAQVTVKVTRP